ncbi:MAG: DnaJ domain-containing protein, partial [Bradyrhizobiaceae bacterium]|nr:DnaJ domain-containing protein [Bradyrhizobiaceae bacterium]
MKSLYELLGASPDDDAEALKKAFRTAIKAYHPDLHPGDPDAQARFEEIIAAHALLSDAGRRANYDRQLQLEREYLSLASRQPQSKPAPSQSQSAPAPRQIESRLAPQHLRSKTVRATAVIAAVGALIGGYRLATVATTGNVEVSNDEVAATTGVAVKHQTAIVVAAAKTGAAKGDSANGPVPTVGAIPMQPAAAGAAKTDAAKGDSANGPVQTVGAIPMQPAAAGAAKTDAAKGDSANGPVQTVGAIPMQPAAAGAAKTDAAKGDSANGPVQTVGAIPTQSAAAGAAKTDAAKGDSATGPARTVGAIPMQQANPADQGLPGDKHGTADALNGASEPGPGDFEKKRADVAEKELAPERPSNNAGDYKAQGIASYQSGDFAQAIASFNAAILLHPDDAQAYNVRGNAWDEMGVVESALADYDASIRIDPENPAVFHDRAIMWLRQGQLDKALVDLDRAIRFSFSDVRTYCDRGL